MTLPPREAAVDVLSFPDIGVISVILHGRITPTETERERVVNVTVMVPT